jgi:hypothetical protein
MLRINALSIARRTLSTHSNGIVALKGTPALLAKRLPLTKIVATIGPASENMPMLGHVVNAGMRIMRINFSHAVSDVKHVIVDIHSSFEPPFLVLESA